MEILDNIPFVIDRKRLLEKLHIKENDNFHSDLQVLLKQIEPRLKPKAIYKVSYIESRNGDTAIIDGIEFTSRILMKNLEQVGRVFPFIATCGNELENLDIDKDDFLKIYWLDVIKEMALNAAVKFLHDRIKQQFGLKKLPSMSPGSGTENVWPIEQQKPLFQLFGNVEELIGVRLTESFLMIPNKSVSGMCFSDGIEFLSCKLCPRRNCEKRRAPFDEDLKQMYD